MENYERIRRPTPEYTNSPAHQLINSPPQKKGSSVKCVDAYHAMHIVLM